MYCHMNASNYTLLIIINSSKIDAKWFYKMPIFVLIWYGTILLWWRWKMFTNLVWTTFFMHCLTIHLMWYATVYEHNIWVYFSFVGIDFVWLEKSIEHMDYWLHKYLRPNLCLLVLLFIGLLYQLVPAWYLAVKV